jgi:hypothetical protein
VVWLNAKRMDSSVEAKEFEDTLERTKSNTAPAKVLSLNGPRLGIPGSKLLGNDNLPINYVP